MGLLCHPLHCIISSLCSLYYAAMSDEGHQTESAIFTQKDDIIQSVLHEEDLYQILGAPRTASPAELRRCYLERSKICHPDKPPFHELSTRSARTVMCRCPEGPNNCSVLFSDSVSHSTS